MKSHDQTPIEFVPFPSGNATRALESVPEVADSGGLFEEWTEPQIGHSARPSTPIDPSEPATSGELRIGAAPPILESTSVATPPRSARYPFRNWSIRSRLVGLAGVAVALLSLISLMSIWNVTRMNSAASTVVATGAASRLVGESSVELESLVAANPNEVADRGDRIGALLERTGTIVDDAAVAKQVAKANAQVGAYVESRAGESLTRQRSLLSTARASLRKLDSMVDKKIEQAGKRSSSLREQVILMTLGLLVVGSGVLVALAQVVTSSIVNPMRAVGRAIRRFGDGDPNSRAPVSSDEVGTLARSFNAMAEIHGDRLERLNADAERGSQLRLISDALDLAEEEADVYRIAERALAIVTPTQPGEFLVTDSRSPLLSVVAANPSTGPARCPVESPADCVAMRRAQPTVFESQSSINACPKLRMHASPVSAACVPVSVNGHLLGVLHATDADGYPPANNVVEQMVTLAGQLGGRIGAMRTLESTRLQATTDGLTGLANRRMLEAQVAELILSDTPFVLVVADLDRFKTLNDNYGHEFGDRALQLFARVLEANLRGKDIVARYGGEEFVMVLPEMSVAPSMEVVERIRQALARSVESSGLPSITSSFGLTHSTVGDSVESIIRIADAGLMMAKDLGRNRVVFADADLAAEVFTDERERGVLVHAVDVDDTRDARTEAPPVPAETPVVIESTSSADQR